MFKMKWNNVEQLFETLCSAVNIYFSTHLDNVLIYSCTNKTMIRYLLFSLRSRFLFRQNIN